MTEAQKDTRRVTAATVAICDGRHPRDPANASAILVTTEHAVACILLALYPDPATAARMLNEGLVPGIEERLAYYASKGIPG